MTINYTDKGVMIDFDGLTIPEVYAQLRAAWTTRYGPGDDIGYVLGYVRFAAGQHSLRQFVTKNATGEILASQLAWVPAE